MAEIALPTASCPACGKKYRMRPDQAGKPLKCTCGQVFTAPASAPAPPVLGYKTPGAGTDQEDPYFPDKVKDFQIPLALLAAGIPIVFLSAWLEGRAKPAKALTEVGVSMVTDTAAMLAAVLIATRLRGIKLGPFWSAILKLCAISIGPSAGMIFVYFFLQHLPFGGIITWIGGFMFYFALIGMFFDLDQSDTWYCVIVIFIVKLAVYFALAALLR